RDAANFAAAHAWLVASTASAQPALTLAHSLAPYVRDRGLFVRGIAELREALAHEGAADSSLRAAVLFDLAELEQAVDDHASALAHLAQASTLADASLLCRIASREAFSLQRTSDARSKVREAIAAARALGDRHTLQEVLDDAAEVHAAAGDLDTAAELAG